MQIKVEVNGLVYDSQDKACKCILTESQGRCTPFFRYWTGLSKNNTGGNTATLSQKPLSGQYC